MEAGKIGVLHLRVPGCLHACIFKVAVASSLGSWTARHSNLFHQGRKIADVQFLAFRPDAQFDSRKYQNFPIHCHKRLINLDTR
jgi:hypothetical protein